MKIFISYASEQREIADRLRGALVAEGDTVFQDREQISIGEAFHKRIRDELSKSDVFLFLASSDSIAAGCYALSELKQAERQWPNPEGRVIVALLNGLSPDRLPGYLGMISAYSPTGDVVADLLAKIAIIRETNISAHKFSLRLFQGVATGTATLLLLVIGYKSIYWELSDAIRDFYIIPKTDISITPAWVSWARYTLLPVTIQVVACLLSAVIAIRDIAGRAAITLAIVTPIALIPAVYVALNRLQYNDGYDTASLSTKIGLSTALFAAIAAALTSSRRRHWRSVIQNRSNAAFQETHSK